MEVLQAKSNMEWQLRHLDMVRYTKVQNTNMTLEEKNTSYSQYNCTCKFSSEICMVLYHNVKNLMAEGNKINLKKYSSSSSYLFYNSGLFY